MNNDDMSQRLVRRFHKEASWPGGPQWTEEERSLLGNVSSVGYRLGKDVRKDVHAHLAKLTRLVGNDRDKKEWIKNCQDLVEKANMALNQIGYSARSTYDVRWASESEGKQAATMLTEDELMASRSSRRPTR